MKGIQGALQSKTVNDLAVAFITGYAVVSFIWSVGGSLFGDLLDTGGSFTLKGFVVDLLVLAAALLAADWVSRMQK